MSDRTDRADSAPVVVVGAGIAGAACARALVDAGIAVRVLDRGRAVGGRLAGRDLGGRPVDLGGSYLTVSDDAFASLVSDWEARGLARPWTDTFDVVDDGVWGEPKQGPVRWGAAHGLRSLVEDLTDGLPLERRDVARVDRADTLLVDGEPARAVVLAMPDPQAARLLGPGLASDRDLLTRDYEPVLALAAWFGERFWDRSFDGAFVNGDEAIAWIADDGARRGDGGACLVAHSTTDLAAAHLDAPGAAGPELVARLRALLDLPEPLGTHLQRWTFARPTGDRPTTFHLGDSLLGVCGDGWGPTPKVETAWLSGRALGAELAERLG